MNIATANPWVSRFDDLLDLTTIRRRATVLATPVPGLTELPPEVAGKLLENALGQVYIPTDQGCELLQLFAETALAHSLVRYPSIGEFQGENYERGSELSKTVVAGNLICLTGLGGEGKTALLAALRRVLPLDSEIFLDARDSKYPLQSIWSIQVQEKTGIKKLLMAMLARSGLTEFPCNDIPGLIGAAIKRAYLCGTSLITVDETQFISKSKASTLISNFLMNLQIVGPATIYACNYDLLYKLLRRAQQERHRLLARIVVLKPDSPDSESWRTMIGEHNRVSPGILSFDPDSHGKLLYEFSAGNRRLVIQLVKIAYRISRKRRAPVVEKSDIEKAYLSPDFAVYREEIKLLRQQALSNSKIKGHEDLWCPIPTSPPGKGAFQEIAETQHGERVAKLRLLSSLTPAEREAYEETVNRRSSNKPVGKPSRKVVPLTRKSIPTAAELRENAKAFREQLEKDE